MSVRNFVHETTTLLISRNPVSLAAGVFVVAVAILTLARSLLVHSKDEHPDVPLYTPETRGGVGGYKKRWSYDNPNALREAYTKFPNRLFKIWTSQGNQLALPARYLDELKMLPDTKFPSSLRSFFLGPYLWPVDQWKLDYVQKGLHKDLNKHLPSMFNDAKEGAASLIPLEFPECQDWTAVKVYPKVLRLVSRINTKILVGNGLHENSEWIDISARYTRNIFVSSAKLRIFHPVLRPVAQFLIPELRDVWRCNRRARDLLAPILADKVARERQQNIDRGGNYKKPTDSVEWVRDSAVDPKDKNDPHLHAIVQLIIGALSVNTTSQLITNCLFNLATYPECATMLRDEVDQVLSEIGGDWTMDSMAQLPKMDSFIKETLRHSGHLTITFQRTTLTTIPLSDGTSLPANTTYFVPANAINFDPTLYPDPEVFDALRFHKLRLSSADQKKFQLTSISPTQMQFGLGRHACPGRYIAAHQVKLTLAFMLRKYDIALKKGEKRPATVFFQTNQFPDPNGEVVFKNRL